MILVRTIFQAKFGKADNLVEAIKASFVVLNEEQLAALQPRILTDISGEFDTVVVETTHENLAGVEQFRAMLRAQGADSDEPSQLEPFIAGGRNEYYTIEY